MFRFRVEIAGTVQMDRGIARFADGVTDYRPIWPIIEDDFYAQVKDQFKSEGAEGGAAWAPLAASTLAWKEVHYPGTLILHRTGNLEASLTSANDPNAVHRAERKTLTLGSSLPYALFHQVGTSRMPARPEIVLPEGFKRTVMHHVQTYLVQMASACGFRTGLGPLASSKFGGPFGGFAPRGLSPRVGTDGTVHF